MVYCLSLSHTLIFFLSFPFRLFAISLSHLFSPLFLTLFKIFFSLSLSFSFSLSFSVFVFVYLTLSFYLSLFSCSLYICSVTRSVSFFLFVSHPLLSFVRCSLFVFLSLILGWPFPFPFLPFCHLSQTHLVSFFIFILSFWETSRPTDFDELMSDANWWKNND